MISTPFFFLVLTILFSMENVMSLTLKQQPRIAVIGAGAAGMSSARVLSRMGLTPTVLEAREVAGGVWLYKRNSKTRPMYRGLRTNLPKEVMAFREKPWQNVDESFVTHSDVVDYLNKYVEDFGLEKFIKFSSPVKQLTVLDSESEVSSFSPPSEKWPKIKLDFGAKESDVFDAVFICNGHYAEASSPVISGLAQHFRGKVMHSVSYDDPSQYEGQNVLCIGGRASGSDLAREISFYANHVYLSDTTCKLDDNGDPKRMGKVTWVPKTIEILEDGSVAFEDNCKVASKIDTIIFCSGYEYSFPFITSASNMELNCISGERRVTPLYEQLWHAQHPNICFIGVPHSVVPFPLFELQAEAVMSQLHSFSLPDEYERILLAKKDSLSKGVKAKGRVQDTHFLGSHQWDYCRKMARLAGIDDKNVEAFISTNMEIYDHAGKARKSLFPGGPDSYRSIKYKRDGSFWGTQ